MVGRAGLLDARHFLSSGRGYPLTVSSVIKYKPGVEEDRRLRYVVNPGRSPLVTNRALESRSRLQSASYLPASTAFDCLFPCD